MLCVARKQLANWARELTVKPEALGQAAESYFLLQKLQKAQALSVGGCLAFAGLLDKAFVPTALLDASAFQYLKLDGQRVAGSN